MITVRKMAFGLSCQNSSTCNYLALALDARGKEAIANHQYEWVWVSQRNTGGKQYDLSCWIECCSVCSIFVRVIDNLNGLYSVLWFSDAIQYVIFNMVLVTGSNWLVTVFSV